MATETIPSFSEFRRLSRTCNVIPVYREIVVDRITPLAAYERLQAGEPYSYLLESVEGGERLGRYSFIGQNPHAVFCCQNELVTYRQGSAERTWKTTNPLHDLRSIFGRIRPASLPNLPRFWGGAVGYWAYDAARFFERLPNSKQDPLKLPEGAFQLSGDLLVFDRFAQTAKIVVNVFIPESLPSQNGLKALYSNALKSISRMTARIQEHKQTPKPARPTHSNPTHTPLMQHADYLRAVEKAKAYIRAGEIIQVVLSQRWLIKSKASPLQVYRALRLVNPSPYMYCYHFEDIDIVGTSPELLVRKEGKTAETRPIAGTRPRGQTPVEEGALVDELLHDKKERAEHLMLVDLGRNDLGRVCEAGSVKVPEFMTVEKYSHVMHLVSSVTGRLSPQVNAFELLQACFPAGTVAGAPKIRAMEIIAELEPLRRGPYAGSLGYFSYTGNMDMAITIRTLIFKGGKAYLQAGAGIVADSVPEREYRECQHKAAALLAAVSKATLLS